MCLTHYITHCFQFGEEGKMAAKAIGNPDSFYSDIPEILPVSHEYIVVNWINVIPNVPEAKMSNFDVDLSTCYYWEESKTVFLNDYPWELKFCDRDSSVFGSVMKNCKFRTWFKCISDPRMVCTDKIIGGEEGEITEELAQSGFLAIRIQNDAEIPIHPHLPWTKERTKIVEILHSPYALCACAR